MYRQARDQTYPGDSYSLLALSLNGFSVPAQPSDPEGVLLRPNSISIIRLQWPTPLTPQQPLRNVTVTLHITCDLAAKVNITEYYSFQ